jgi:antitoxin VapB
MGARAKLFRHGRSQAVRLPKEFRLPGYEVLVSKVGNKVILEPIEPAPFDVDAWLERLRQYADVPFPDLPDDPPVGPDDMVTFD